jgi:hypothetical protein
MLQQIILRIKPNQQYISMKPQNHKIGIKNKKFCFTKLD